MPSASWPLVCSVLALSASIAAGQGSDHWAFQPIKQPDIPKVRNAAWVRTPIDAFIAARHEAFGVSPAAAADPRTLIRRLSLDLTGLPPSVAETDAFCAAWSRDADAAVAQAVDRLLASSHHGERWARHWLDVARWAESEGYESNHPRPYAWRFRDWVVKAFNDDVPFADFVRAQLAGDEIEPYTDDNLIATGFLAAARLSSNEEDRWRQRNDLYVDVVNTTAAAFLGLTMQCAQCHGHKSDDISARDYYRFQGFFVKGQPGNLTLTDPKLWAAYEARKPAGYDGAVRERDTLVETARQRRLSEIRDGFSAGQREALALTMEQRSPEEEKTAREADLLLQISTGQIENALAPDERKRYDALKKQIIEMEKGMLDRPQTFGFYAPSTSRAKVTVLPMRGFYPLAYDPAELARARSYLLSAGDVHRPSSPVDVGWPAVLGPSPRAEIEKTPRLALANWLASSRNPLSARVHVNRIWQHHFGRGIVATPNDFGVKGAPPTHPELLDWLAAEFLRSGGSTRHLHRLIVLSNTYRQSAQGSATAAKVDPENNSLWRWQPRRLEAEAIHDSYLAVSGELDRAVGGPSIVPADDNRRRSLYLVQKREAPPAHQAQFDGPFAMTESCGRRQVTTVPLQPLYLLNSTFSVQAADALARRVQRLAGDDRENQITMTFRLALSRCPDAKERELARRFFDREPEAPARAEQARAEQSRPPPGLPTPLQRFCQAILNLNEFVYLE